MSDTAERKGVGVILVRDNKVLLGRRLGALHHGEWGLPGGLQEAGESDEETARREAMEEVGVRVISLQYAQHNPDLFSAPEYLELNHQIGTAVMEALEFEGQPAACEPAKCAEWKWFGWMDLPEPLHLPVAALYMSGYVPSLIAKEL